MFRIYYILSYHNNPYNNKHTFNFSIEFPLTDLAFINIFQGINIPIPCRTKIRYTIFHLEQSIKTNNIIIINQKYYE